MLLVLCLPFCSKSVSLPFLTPFFFLKRATITGFSWTLFFCRSCRGEECKDLLVLSSSRPFVFHLLSVSEREREREMDKTLLEFSPLVLTESLSEMTTTHGALKRKRSREKENIFTVLPVDVGFLLAAKKRYILILKKEREQEVPSSLPLFLQRNQVLYWMPTWNRTEIKWQDFLFLSFCLKFYVCFFEFLDRLRQRNCFLSWNQILGPDRHAVATKCTLSSCSPSSFHFLLNLLMREKRRIESLSLEWTHPWNTSPFRTFLPHPSSVFDEEERDRQDMQTESDQTEKRERESSGRFLQGREEERKEYTTKREKAIEREWNIPWERNTQRKWRTFGFGWNPTDFCVLFSLSCSSPVLLLFLEFCVTLSRRDSLFLFDDCLIGMKERSPRLFPWHLFVSLPLIHSFFSYSLFLVSFASNILSVTHFAVIRSVILSVILSVGLLRLVPGKWRRKYIKRRAASSVWSIWVLRVYCPGFSSSSWFCQRHFVFHISLLLVPSVYQTSLCFYFYFISFISFFCSSGEREDFLIISHPRLSFSLLPPHSSSGESGEVSFFSFSSRTVTSFLSSSSTSHLSFCFIIISHSIRDSLEPCSLLWILFYSQDLSQKKKNERDNFSFVHRPRNQWDWISCVCSLDSSPTSLWSLSSPSIGSLFFHFLSWDQREGRNQEIHEEVNLHPFSFILSNSFSRCLSHILILSFWFSSFQFLHLFDVVVVVS